MSSFSPQPSLVLGPWLVGLTFEVFLTGVVCCQLAHYFTLYTTDKLSLKIVVAVLGFLCVLKSVQCFVWEWVALIDNYGQIFASFGMVTKVWYASYNAVFTEVIGLYVQAYFLWRLYAISKSWLIIVPICAILLFGFIAAFIFSDVLIKQESGTIIPTWFACHVSAVFAGDLFITLATAFYLVRSKKRVLPQTVGLLNALLRLTFQTAAPAAICAMLTLILTQVYSNTDGLNMIYGAFSHMHPKLYAISMMWTLNARQNIRATSRSTNSTTPDASIQRTRRTNTNHNDLELGAIHVQTHIETHLDAKDMYDSGENEGDEYSVRKPIVH